MGTPTCEAGAERRKGRREAKERKEEGGEIKEGKISEGMKRKEAKERK